MWFVDENSNSITDIPVGSYVALGSVLFLALVILLRFYEFFTTPGQGLSLWNLAKGLAEDLTFGIIIMVTTFYALGFVLELARGAVAGELNSVADVLAAIVATDWPEADLTEEDSLADIARGTIDDKLDVAGAAL